MGTFGEIYLNNRRLYTIERPWLDNKPRVSCVPSGEYDLLWKPTTTPVPNQYDGHTWYLEGETVSSGWSGKPRTRCALHVANIMQNVNGCIGIGRTLGSFKRQWAINGSRVAMVDLLSAIGGEDHCLTIRWQNE